MSGLPLDPRTQALAAYAGSDAGTSAPQLVDEYVPNYNFRRTGEQGSINGTVSGIGQAIRRSAAEGLLGKGLALNDLLLRGGPVAGAAGYGLGGYGTGLLAGKLAELLGSDQGTASTWANIGGLAGLLGGGYAGYQRRKYGSAMGADAIIAQALMADRSLDSFTRDQLLAAARGLDDSTKSRLVSLLASLGSAAAGAVVMRFLGGGAMATAGAGLLSGWVGGNVFDRLSTGNLYGQKSYQSTNTLGTPYLF